MVENEENKEKGEELQHVVFHLEDEEFGVEVSQVREIIKMAQITRIPNAPSFIEGVINIRGEITTVVDLRTRLGLERKEHDEKSRIIVVDIKDVSVGMVVDFVSEVLRLNTADIDPTPTLIESEMNTDYIYGVGKLDNRLLILLNLQKVLTEREVGELTELDAGSKALMGA